MNETLELWSAPWHSLQRNLADRLAAEMSRIIAGIAVAGGAQPGTDAAPSLARPRTHADSTCGRAGPVTPPLFLSTFARITGLLARPFFCVPVRAHSFRLSWCATDHIKASGFPTSRGMCVHADICFFERPRVGLRIEQRRAPTILREARAQSRQACGFRHQQYAPHAHTLPGLSLISSGKPMARSALAATRLAMVLPIHVKTGTPDQSASQVVEWAL